MSHRHAFSRICNQVTCHKGILHTDMPHGNTVADCDRRKLSGDSPCHRNAKLHCLCDLIQVHVPRNDFIVGIYNTDQRLFHLFFRKSQSMEQRAMGSLLNSFFYCVASHNFPPSFSDSRGDQITHLSCAYLRTAFRHNIHRAIAFF